MPLLLHVVSLQKLGLGLSYTYIRWDFIGFVLKLSSFYRAMLRSLLSKSAPTIPAAENITHERFYWSIGLI